MRYILAYFALMLGLSGLSLLWAGRAYGFVLLLIAAVLIYLLVRMERTRRRERRYGGYGEAIEGYEKRFTDAQSALEAKLPQDALDSAPLLELLSAYEHDPTDADGIRNDYAELRRRFLDWREEFERMRALSEAGAVGLPKEFAERYEHLGQQLTDLLADVKRLESRAAEVGRQTDDPLDGIAQAALKLEQAKSTCAHRFDGQIPVELAALLSAADEKLAEARSAIAKGAERPLEAIRLAQEVGELAVSVEARSVELAEAPGELNAECVRLAAEIADAKARLEAAAEAYSPSCLLEIRGCGAEAEKSLEHASVLAASGRETGADVRLAQAREALARAAALITRIDEHLNALDRAAVEARHDVEQAELAADRAWAAAATSSQAPDEGARTELVAARARELAAEARTETEQTQPDWFRATALARRAVELARQLGACRTGSTPVEAFRPEVEAARARAEAALTDARPLVAEADGLLGEDNMARVCLERAQKAYERALALADGADADAHAAVDGFHLAEDSASAAREHALGLRGRDGARPPAKTAARLLWGAIESALAPD